MTIEQCRSQEDLHKFLSVTCGFKLVGGFSPASGTGEHVYGVSEAGDTIDVMIVDDASSAVLNEQAKKLSMATATAQYQMIVQADFQRIAIQRAKAPASWGRNDRYRVVYNASSQKEDTKKNIIAKINGLRYQTLDEQDAFSKFFNVHELVDKFYADYEKFRKKLAAAISFPIAISDAIRNEYATTVMNRIIFTFFLQTPAPSGHSVIPPEYMQSLHLRSKQPFYRCLTILWFDHFNNDGPRSRADDGEFAKIPYLNGGLFAYKDGIEKVGTRIMHDTISIDDEIFDEIFAVLGGYEWTLLESSGDETFSITPEILGHIYEKQCNQKETGSYYTPDHVTNYIIRECIAKLATDRVNEHFKTKYEKFIDILNKESLLADELQHISWFREEVLYGITICDNACGSGAFLLAAEKILVDLHVACNNWCKPGDGKYLSTLHAIKRHIITRNLFGVDIQPGSVEIAKLRLWLSMIPAMQPGQVDPLPNIDYNIIAGNSLIGFVAMPAKWGKSLFSNPDMLAKKVAEYRSLKDAYRDATKAIDAVDLKQKIEATIAAVRSELDALLAANLAVTPAQMDTLKPFHWCFEFEETFSQGGFDIVIGNPPYINYQKTTGIEKKVFIDKFGLSDDLYNYFFRQSFNLLKKGGLIGYITSNTYFTLDTKKSLREFLQSKRIIEIRVPDPKLFRGVGVITAIMIAKNTDSDSDYNLAFTDAIKSFEQPIKYISKISTFENANENVFFMPHELNMAIYKKLNEPVKKLVTEWWDKISTSKNITKHAKDLEAYRKALKEGGITLLGLITDGGQGIATANNGKFISVIKGHKLATRIVETRPDKLWNFIEFARKKGLKIDQDLLDIKSKNGAKAFLDGKSEKEIWNMFDIFKDKYGIKIFGKGYVYKIIDRSEIRNINTISATDKSDGIDKGNSWIIFSKGDSEGNKWYFDEMYYIDWSRNNVKWFYENNGKKGEGMPVVRNPQYYFKEGFCWSKILNPQALYIKTRISPPSVFDSGNMTLFSLVTRVPDYYLISLLNSIIITQYRVNFLNNTANVELNDGRMFPIIVPSNEKLNLIKNIFDDAVSIKKQQFAGSISNDEAKKRLDDIQERVDKATCELYGIPYDLIKKFVGKVETGDERDEIIYINGE